MNDRTLIIRADASETIGVGHLLRSLAIGQQWRADGGTVLYAVANLPAAVKPRLLSEGMQIQGIFSIPGSPEDARELLSLAASKDVSAIVLDGYHFGSDYQAAIAKFPGWTLVIDDNAHLPKYTADLILNQNIGASAETYAGKAGSSKLLLGPEFALIRSEFRSPGDRPKPKSNPVRRILVTLGGSDPTNATETVIDGLRSIEQPDLEFRVIVGQLNPNRERLHARVKADNRFVMLDYVHDMSEQYRWADFAIAAGGSSNWEMCYFGIPRLLLVIAENQANIAKQLHLLGVGKNLGIASEVSAAQASQQLEAFVASPARLQIASQRSFELVDGLGAQRCVEQLIATNE